MMVEVKRCRRVGCSGWAYPLTLCYYLRTPTPMSIRAPRKGENYELSVDLNSEYRDKRKDAIKRVIASMTVGKGATIYLGYPTRHRHLGQTCLVSFPMSSKTCRRTTSNKRNSYTCIS